MPTINKLPKKKKEYDIARKDRMKIYNSSMWRKLRDIKVKEQPLCEICLIEGRIKLSEDCHHLQTFTSAKNEIERDLLAFDSNNIINLCDECHNAIHHGKYKGCITKEDIIKRYEYLKDKEK